MHEFFIFHILTFSFNKFFIIFCLQEQVLSLYILGSISQQYHYLYAHILITPFSVHWRQNCRMGSCQCCEACFSCQCICGKLLFITKCRTTNWKIVQNARPLFAEFAEGFLPCLQRLMKRFLTYSKSKQTCDCVLSLWQWQPICSSVGRPHFPRSHTTNWCVM